MIDFPVNACEENANTKCCIQLTVLLQALSALLVRELNESAIRLSTASELCLHRLDMLVVLLTDCIICVRNFVMKSVT